MSPGTKQESAGDVAKYLGLVARVHNYINAREAEKSLPGCRTVVASGLRQCFEDRQGREDFFSANLAAAVAFKAQEQGSAVGVTGNHLYVEKDVAVAISYIEMCHAIMALAKFDRPDSVVTDPYCYHPPDSARAVTVTYPSWRAYDPIVIGIMNNEYTFRRLNSLALTNLQLFTDYRRLAEEQDPEDLLAASIRGVLAAATPTIAEIWRASNITRPFLFTSFPLELDYNQFFNCE
jgi:hypothetical protein